MISDCCANVILLFSSFSSPAVSSSFSTVWKSDGKLGVIFDENRLNLDEFSFETFGVY